MQKLINLYRLLNCTIEQNGTEQNGTRKEGTDRRKTERTTEDRRERTKNAT